MRQAITIGWQAATAHGRLFRRCSISFEARCALFDTQCDLAALVYQQDEDPDQILRDFAAHLNGVLAGRPQQTFCEALE